MEGEKVSFGGEEFEVISVYTDEQGLEDGALIDVLTLKLVAGSRVVDRCTSNLWIKLRALAFYKSDKEKDAFVSIMLKRMCHGWQSPWVTWEMTGEDTRIIKTKTAAGIVWAVENERGNYTIMLPEDY